MKQIFTISNQLTAKLKRLAMVLTMLLIVGIGQVWGADYELVTTAPSDWSGEYLIVAGTSALSGGTSSWGTIKTVTVTNNKISTTENISVTISKGGTSGTYYIYMNSNSLYLKEVTSNTFSTASTSSTDTEWKITLNNGNAQIACASSTTRYLRLNGTSGYRCYTTATGTLPKLYKKAASYTITAKSNNNTYGTVSLSGTTITASPKTGYRVSTTTPYTISPSGSATITQNGNTFTVTPSANTTITINFEALPKYTVTLMDDESTLTQSTAGGSVTLPSRDGCDGYEFVGWTKSWSVAQTTWTTTAPTIIPDGSYTPTANENLYPVYTKTETTQGTPTTTSKTYSHTITAKTWSANGAQTLNNVSWTLTNDGNYYGYDGTKGQQVGSGSSPAKSMTLTTSGFSSATKITAVRISTSGASSISGSVGVTVGSTAFKSGTATTKSLSSTNTEYEFTGSSSGNVTISWSQTSSKAIYFKAIEVDYQTTTGGGNTTTTYYISVPDCTTETAVTLHPNGGTIGDRNWTPENGVYKLTTEDESITLPTITRTGYTFGGWATSSGGTEEHNANAIIPLDGTPVTLYAIWTANTYNITYKDQGNAAFSGTHDTGYPTQHTYGTETTLKGATKIGYTFEGWYKDAACTNKVTTLGATEYTSAITLYAKWTAKALTNYRTFCDVVCDAYSFHTGTGEKETWSKEAIKCFTEAEDGYEHEWQIKDYIIPNDDDKFFVGNYGYFYNDNLGIGGANGKSRSVVSDWGNMYLASAMDENDAPGTPRLGHAKGAKGTLRIFEDSNWDNLYVGFIPDGYKLQFGNEEYTLAKTTGTEYRSDVVQYSSTNTDKNVSVGVVDADGKYVATNHTQEMRHIFVKDNCGWRNNDAKLAIYYWGGSEGWCGFLKIVPGDETLFEGWIPSNVTNLKFVRYNSNQSNPGSWDYENDIWNSTGDLTIDGNLFTITDWGTGTWSTYEKYGQFAMHDNSKSKNWYVHFVPHYVLKYDKNADDATDTMDIQTVAVDAANKGVVVADCGFTRPGYRFIKWRKGTTSTYYVPNGSNSIELNADITLYAVWEKEYTVTYNANGGTTSCVDNNAYIKGETVTVCNKVPTKTGYTFDGWTYSPEVTITDGKFTMPASNVTITAQWTINQYTVTWIPNGGNWDSSTDNKVDTYEYGATILKPADPTREGYRFDGWDAEIAVTMGTGNLTYTAQWTKVYSVILSENGTTTELESQTSTSYTLPTELTAGSCQDDTKEFVGWTTNSNLNSAEEPTTDYYAKGEIVTLSADETTFYAVFATPGSGGGSGNYIKVTSEPTDWSGDYLIVANGNCFDGSRTTIDAAGNYQAVTISNNEIASSNTTDSYIVSISKSTNIGKYYIKTKSGYYIGSTATNDNELLNSTTTKYDNTISISGNDVTIKGTNSIFKFYVQSGQTPRFRYYKSSTNTTLPHLYKKSSGTTYSDYTTTCVKLPDPVLSFATEPANPIVFTDAVCGGNSSKQSVTVVGENLRDVVEVNVTGPYKIARTASTALNAFTTSLTLDKTAAGAIHSIYIISTPPAQSTEATTGTLTFTTTKGNTLTVNLSTPTVTCTQYTLTLVDRGVSTEQPTKYYAGETIDEAPADPEGVCTDPIHYVFDGWAAATVAEGSTTYTKVTFPYTVKGNTKFYAVYRYLEGGGNGDYNLVTSALDDWSGDYLIAYSDQIFANGTIGGESGIGAKNNKVDLSSNISNNTIPATVGDQYNVTLEAVTGGYVLKTKDGNYNYHTNNTGNGISASTIGYADDYPITVKFVSEEEINLCLGGSAIGSVFRYNAQGFFRFYKNGGQNPVYLYKKADGTTYYTTSPVCGPHLAITEGKEIYVTGGNAGGTRDLVIAQQKVSYKATRLKTSNGLADGTAPDVKVATNGITVGGVVTSDVKVTIDQNKEQQTDGTYTITGTITVQYQPSANNKQEDIQVQLAVDYNAEARDNFTVHARSLPAEFVIVAKSGDKWYALNGDMNNGSSANPANGQVTLDDDANPTKATYAPCNTIYTFDGVPNTGDRTRVRFQGTDGAWLWAASGINVGIQNKSLKDTPEGDNKAYNWKLETEDNITYKFHNDNSSRLLGLSGEKFGMYASAVQELRILPYVEKCLYNYAPSNLIVKELKGSYVVLTWDAVVGATKYQYSTNATTWTDAGTEPTVTINGLEGDTEYIYYIRAYHEDAGVTNECIDYAEITFTTADCDDVPTNITYTADLNSITVSWTAAAPTATIKLFMNEDGTGGGGTYPGAKSPYRISGGLDKNTTYYIQILSDGTCASPIIPVKTEDVEVDIVEWKTDGIVVDINTNETVGVTLENEVSYGSGLGTEATELFFSKYYEASYNVKLVAIYNGTKNIIDLTDYIIKYGKTSWENNYITLKDFGATKGQIQPGEEIILYSYTENNADDKKILDCVHEAFPDGNWVRVTSSNNDGEGTLSFGGDKTIVLKKADNIIDVIGAIAANGLPTNSAVTSPSWGDAKGWTCETGLSIADDTQIGISTNRCLLIRNNTVTSGENAVTQNIADFVTLCTEWKGAQVPDSDIDNGVAASCENFAYVGTFDYSDYYTKYVPMDGGTSTFDENDRNPDGTVSIYIPDLYKRACSNIRVKLTNSDGEVLTDREYKVPIMITSTQGTNGQTFLDLQQNLATKEVDAEGNVIRTYPLTLDEVREICKTCDVVIRDNATLTKVTDGTENDHPQVNNVMIYEGASLEIPSGADYNYTINSLSLRRKGDIVASAKVEEGGKLHLPASATAPIYLDMRIDANNWHWFTLPYNCNIADVTWVDGTPAQYNKDWFIMYYDGNSRANEQSIYENHWRVYNGTTIEAGKGYIVGIQGDITHPDYTFELRFPMTTDVLTNEHIDKIVAVNAWGVNMDITPNKKGWNLVGNPYLDYYKTSENISFTGLSLIKYEGIDPVTGDRLYDDSGNVPFLVTPVDGGWYEYQQELASDVEMMPFTAYFVQVGDPAKASHTDGMELHAKFVSDHRGRMSLIRRAPQEVDGEQEPVIVRVEVANAKGESDKTTLIIDDRFTNEYEMNGDFFKWFGDYYRRYTKPVLYSMGADQGKRAFNALSEQLAAQPVALGMFAAQAGDYTFSLTRKRCDLSRVEEVWLYDATTATYTNLMQQDYTFTTAKTEGEGRFYLSVKMRQNAPTDITDIYGGNVVATAKDGQIIVGGLTDNTQLWIYDATGKLLHTEQTTNFQHVYEVPVVGTYFVRTQLAGQAQTIKVLVE